MLTPRRFPSTFILLILAVASSSGLALANDIKVYPGSSCVEAADMTITLPIVRANFFVNGGRFGNFDDLHGTLAECPFVIDDSASGAMDVTVWAQDRSAAANLSCRVVTLSESGSSSAWSTTRYATPSQTNEVGHVSGSARVMKFSVSADYALGPGYIYCDIPPWEPITQFSAVSSYWVNEY